MTDDYALASNPGDQKHLLEGFSSVLARNVELLDDGGSPGELVEAVSQSIDEFGHAVATEYLASSSEHAQYLRGIQDSFERSLYEVWGPALDAFAVFVAAAHKYGSDFNSAYRASAVRHDSFCFEVLVGLHARACRTASEIGALLRSGHATGALGRWRSLHEVAVTGYLIREGGDELAERYLLHENVSSYSDMVEYNEYADSIDGERFTDEEVADAKAASDALVDRFGKSFGRINGWAAALTEDQPSWTKLERLAKLDHLRPWYSWSSHGIHATSKGGSHVVVATNDGRALQSGPDTAGLTEPGTATLVSLFQITTSLLTWRPDDVDEVEASMWLSVLAILAELQDEAELRFVDGHEKHETRVNAHRSAKQ